MLWELANRAFQVHAKANINISEGFVGCIADEIWIKVPLSDEYEEIYASNFGRIRRNGKVSFGSICDSGYMIITIVGTTKKQMRVHILVCMAFHGMPPDNKY